MTSPVLQLDGIMVTASERAILDVQSFQVSAAESVALVGPNGAGKSTLLHVAALLKQPAAGEVTILGERASLTNAAALRRQLSVVFQDPLLFDIPVLANAAAGLRFQGFSRYEAERRARAWLDRFGVLHLTTRKARGLSGGEASRVALARAFATDPALLLLDEPFSALDAPTRAALLPALRVRLRETGAAAVLVTHDLEEAFAFTDRVVLMDQGTIVASGSAPQLIARPPSRRAAELLGIETILSGLVVGADGDTLTFVAIPGEVPVRACGALSIANSARFPATLTLPASAARILRPDERPPTCWNALAGTVKAVAPHRAGWRIVIETPAELVAISPWEQTATPWAPGDRVTVAFPPEAAYVVPATTAR